VTAEALFQRAEYIECVLHAEPDLEGVMHWRPARYLAPHPGADHTDHVVTTYCSDGSWRHVTLRGAHLRKAVVHEPGTRVEAQLHEGGTWTEVTVLAQAGETYRVRWEGHQSADYWEGPSDWEVPIWRVKKPGERGRAQPRDRNWGPSPLGDVARMHPRGQYAERSAKVTLSDEDLHCLQSICIALGEELEQTGGTPADQRLYLACDKILLAFNYPMSR
jgi:hypothetical protein